MTEREKNMAEEIRQEIQKSAQEADLVLVGIGTEFSKKNARKEEIMEAYRKLADLLKGKNYFLLTVNTDDLIFESAIDSERIVAPCGSDKTGNVVTNDDYDESWYMPQWEKYTKWLQGTVNKKVCVLELGVGFEYPTVIRFAFEKIVYFNQKCHMYRIHEKFAQLTPEIKDRTTAVKENAVKLLLEDGADVR